MASAKLMPVLYLGDSMDRPYIVYQRTRFCLENSLFGELHPN